MRSLARFSVLAIAAGTGSVQGSDDCFSLFQKLTTDGTFCLDCYYYDPSVHVDEFGFLVRPTGDIRVVYGSSTDPIVRVYRGATIPGTEQGVQTQVDALVPIYRSYLSKDAVRIEDVKINRAMEKSLPRGRQSYAAAWKQGRDHPCAFMRVFDGRSTTPPIRVGDARLPLEREASLRKIAVQSVQKARDAGRDVFEIGKVLIDKELSTADAVKSGVGLQSWLLQWAEEFPEGVFFVDTFSSARVRRFQRQYGFSEDPARIEELLFSGGSEKEYVLQATGKELAAKLRNNLARVSSP